MKQTQERSILIIDEVEEIAGQTRDEVVVHNACFIPQKVGVERYAELIDRGLAVQVLTNSLGSNDEIVTNSAYKRYRKPLLEAGVDLWEMRFDPEEAARFRTPPNQRGYTVLHTKSFVVDRRLSFVGSLNLDPRAIDINTEMGILVDDPVLAQPNCLKVPLHRIGVGPYQARMVRAVPALQPNPALFRRLLAAGRLREDQLTATERKVQNAEENNADRWSVRVWVAIGGAYTKLAGLLDLSPAGRLHGSSAAAGHGKSAQPGT